MSLPNVSASIRGDLDDVAGKRRHFESSSAFACYEAGGVDDDSFLAHDTVDINGGEYQNYYTLDIYFNSESASALWGKGHLTFVRNPAGVWSMRATQQGGELTGAPWTFCEPSYTVDVAIAMLNCFDSTDETHSLQAAIAEIAAQKPRIIKSSAHYTNANDCEKNEAITTPNWGEYDLPGNM